MEIRQSCNFHGGKGTSCSNKRAETIALDYKADAVGLYMHSESQWEYLWAKAENDIHKTRIDSLKYSDATD